MRRLRPRTLGKPPSRVRWVRVPAMLATATPLGPLVVRLRGKLRTQVLPQGRQRFKSVQRRLRQLSNPRLRLGLQLRRHPRHAGVH